MEEAKLRRSNNHRAFCSTEDYHNLNGEIVVFEPENNPSTLIEVFLGRQVIVDCYSSTFIRTGNVLVESHRAPSYWIVL